MSLFAIPTLLILRGELILRGKLILLGGVGEVLVSGDVVKILGSSLVCTPGPPLTHFLKGRRGKGRGGPGV